MDDAMQRISDRNCELARLIGGFCGLLFILKVKRKHGLADDDIVRDLLLLKDEADKVIGGRE